MDLWGTPEVGGGPGSPEMDPRVLRLPLCTSYLSSTSPLLFDGGPFPPSFSRIRVSKKEEGMVVGDDGYVNEGERDGLSIGSVCWGLCPCVPCERRPSSCWGMTSPCGRTSSRWGLCPCERGAASAQKILKLIKIQKKFKKTNKINKSKSS